MAKALDSLTDDELAEKEQALAKERTAIREQQLEVAAVRNARAALSGLSDQERTAIIRLAGSVKSSGSTEEVPK